MEKILFLVHRIPFPPNKGDKTRSFHLRRFLGRVSAIGLFRPGVGVSRHYNWDRNRSRMTPLLEGKSTLYAGGSE